MQAQSNYYKAFCYRTRYIDMVILNLQSVIICQGIALFAPQEFELPLHLEASERVYNEIVQLHYRVQKHTAR
jgi:hypothetical protein